MESEITKVDWWQPIVYVGSYDWCSHVVYPEPHEMKSAAWGGEYKWKPATFTPFKGPDFWEMP